MVAGRLHLHWFAVVGGAATLLYAALAWAGTDLLAVPAPIASVAAYAFAAALSYAGHRRLTFRSSRPHRDAAPRFIGVTAMGYAVAALAPLLLTDLLGAPSLVAIGATCIVVPALNAVALNRVVFRAARPEPDAG